MCFRPCCQGLGISLEWLWGRGRRGVVVGSFLPGGGLVFARLGGHRVPGFGAGLLPRGTHCYSGAFLTTGDHCLQRRPLDWDFLVPTIGARKLLSICLGVSGENQVPISSLQREHLVAAYWMEPWQLLLPSPEEHESQNVINVYYKVGFLQILR